MQQRKQIRLSSYNYSTPGHYFITLCTQNREHIFGNIIQDKMVMSDLGIIVDHWMHQIPKRYEQIELDTYQIMPNHVHMILYVVGVHDNNVGVHHDAPLQQQPYKRGRTNRGDKRELLPICIGYFKMNTTKSINQYYVRAHHDAPQRSNIAPQRNKIWQRNYYEHIIRTHRDLEKIRKYIHMNPILWERDRNNLQQHHGCQS